MPPSKRKLSTRKVRGDVSDRPQLSTRRIHDDRGELSPPSHRSAKASASTVAAHSTPRLGRGVSAPPKTRSPSSPSRILPNMAGARVLADHRRRTLRGERLRACGERLRGETRDEGSKTCARQNTQRTSTACGAALECTAARASHTQRTHPYYACMSTVRDPAISKRGHTCCGLNLRWGGSAVTSTTTCTQ